MKAPLKKRTPETDKAEKLLRKGLPNAEVQVYRYHSYAIRIRIIDDQFRDKSRIDREDVVLPLVRRLPDKTQQDLTFLILLAPGEEQSSLSNMEFESPSPVGL